MSKMPDAAEDHGGNKMYCQFLIGGKKCMSIAAAEVLDGKIKQKLSVCIEHLPTCYQCHQIRYEIKFINGKGLCPACFLLASRVVDVSYLPVPLRTYGQPPQQPMSHPASAPKTASSIPASLYFMLN